MSFGWALTRDSGYLSLQKPTISYVTSNLFLNLDAATYVSGTTWTDLSGNNRNATLINTPTFFSSQGGYFHFTDTSFQYAATPVVPSLSNWTIEGWFRATKTFNNRITAIVCNEWDFSTKLNYSLGSNNASLSYTLAGGFYNGTWNSTVGFMPSLNVWYQGAVTYDGTTITQYSNGVSQSVKAYSGICQSGGTVRIARRWDSANNDSINFFDGDISIIRIYSVALSPSQILQNFNAIKSRYGL
jgi:hypothetical protein